jgi:O-methyltransferase involved in polyketide biosynthesis
MYLTRPALESTLAFIATVIGRNGGVAFDYAVDRDRLTFTQRIVFDRLAARVAAAGEPWLTTFDPADLALRLRALGFAGVDDSGGDELNARYFAGRPDGLRVGGLARMMWAHGGNLT